MTKVETLFRALSDEQRRRLLVGLLDHNPQNDSRTYSEDVALEGEEKNLHIRMHHIHLPLLMECGFIEWNRDKGVVTKGPAFEEIRPALELLDANRETLPCGWL